MSHSSPHDDSHSRSWKPRAEPPASLAFVPMNASAFLVLMADALRLREETLAMAFVYTNRYLRFLRDHPLTDELLDEHTLSLASLSLATKATESPRRLREFLVPAHHVLNRSAPALTFPSPLYDSLRMTLVTAELLLLRILKFDLRLPLPFEYLPVMLRRGLALDGTAHLEDLVADERDEVNVVDVRDTTLGRAVRALAGEAMRSYRLVNYFSPRAVAVACLWVCATDCGLDLPADREPWVRRVTADKVDLEDFEDAVKDIRELRE